LDSLERFLLRSIAAIAGVCFVWWLTPGGTKIDLIFRIASTTIILAIFPAVYLWKFVLAPATMDEEKQRLISDLNHRLDDRETRERIRRALWHLRQEGVQLRNEGLTTTTINSWTQKFNDWHTKVLEQAAACSIDLRHSLDPIDKLSPESNEFVAVPDPFHQKRVSVMSEMLSRLYKYLNQGLGTD
jgi:hypothetical protein